MRWARYSANGYECSSQGDTRFSALFATLADGRTIEEAYQLDIKGYRSITDNWHEAKGQPPLFAKPKQELWAEYLELWRQFARENPALITELRTLATGKVLTDKFANSPVNQAHALSVIISEQEALELLPFTF